MERRKFTLIELLIVISIIAIVLAMLLPALATARRKAESVSCLNSCKQIGFGLHSYTAISNDVLPPSYNYTISSYYGPHLVSAAVFGAPALLSKNEWIMREENLATIEEAMRKSPFTGCPAAQKTYLASTIRWSLFAPDYYDDVLYKISSGSPAPAKKITLFKRTRIGVFWEQENGQWKVYTPARNAIPRLAFRHSGGANAPMLDGSARFFHMTQLLGNAENIFNK